MDLNLLRDYELVGSMGLRFNTTLTDYVLILNYGSGTDRDQVSRIYFNIKNFNTVDCLSINS